MDYIQQVSNYLGTPSLVGQEALFYCPFCEHPKKKLSVNTQSFRWHCWVCQEKGANLRGLLWKSGHKEAAKQFVSFNAVEPEQEDFYLALPEEYVFYDSLPELLRRKVKNSLAQRGLSKSHILHHKIGFCQDGRYADRVILPSFDRYGRINFFTARALNEKAVKYLSPKTPKGYRNSIICNELNIDWDEDVILVEGFFDMVKIANAIPLQGNILSERSVLFRTLVEKAKAVYVCLDSDARKYQFKLMRSLSSFNLPCFDMQISPCKDPGEADATFLQRKKLEAQRITCDNILRKQICEYKNGLDA